jgi:hypothetical protein
MDKKGIGSIIGGPYQSIMTSIRTIYMCMQITAAKQRIYLSKYLTY